MDRTSGDTPIKRAMELANVSSIYKRSESLRSHCTSSSTARGLVSRPKNRA